MGKTQKTKKGHEIPIPTKGEFLKNLKKVAGGKAEESTKSTVAAKKTPKPPTKPTEK